MNRVGQEGKGESIWLGWFLHTILWEFAKVADARGEHKRAETWRLHVSALKAALEQEGWDGEWYRRAYLMMVLRWARPWTRNAALTQLLSPGESSVAPPNQLAERAPWPRSTSIWSAVRRDWFCCLRRPSIAPDHDPGYIKGYLRGIRENGGQYTHAAAWTVLAFAALSDGDKAGELFRMLNPINRTASRATCNGTKWSLTWWQAMFIPNPARRARWVDLVHRVSRMALSRRQSNGYWVSACAERCSRSILAFPESWPNYSMSFRYHSTVYKIRVEKPVRRFTWLDTNGIGRRPAAQLPQRPTGG